MSDVGSKATANSERSSSGAIASEDVSNTAYVFKAHAFTAGPVAYAAANGNNQYNLLDGLMTEYDTAGNLTDDGKFKYTYDAENHLITADKKLAGTLVAAGSYSYDALGRRSEKTDHITGGITTRYAYAGAQVMSEMNSGNIVQRRYVYGPGIDNPLMVLEGTTKKYLHVDGKGSVLAASNTTGGITNKFNTDIYGQGADEATSPYRFTARRMDSETGNYYYRNRYYSARQGRFMQNDPIGYGDGLNMYAYVKNDPVNKRDPMGLTGSCTGSRITNEFGYCAGGGGGSTTGSGPSSGGVIGNFSGGDGGSSGNGTNRTDGADLDTNGSGTSSGPTSTADYGEEIVTTGSPISQLAEPTSLWYDYEVNVVAAERDYLDLEQRVEDFFTGNASGVFALSASDLQVIFRGYYFRDFIERDPKDEDDSDYRGADTFLYDSFPGKKFSYGGKTYIAGQVNYIGIGMMAAHFGHSTEWLRGTINTWNIAQIIKGQGFGHNWSEVTIFPWSSDSPAFYWAKQGYNAYK